MQNDINVIDSLNYGNKVWVTHNNFEFVHLVNDRLIGLWSILWQILLISLVTSFFHSYWIIFN
jgi:hypothetical protein